MCIVKIIHKKDEQIIAKYFFYSLMNMIFIRRDLNVVYSKEGVYKNITSD